MKLKRKAETGMQHLLKQTLLRRAQLTKRDRRDKLLKFREEQHKYRQSKLQSDRWTRQAIKDERKHRREDWLCGPLAPMRDIGEKAGIYGVAGEEIVQAPELPKRLRVKEEDIRIVAGDRVVVVRGIGRGKIGEVQTADLETGTVMVRGIRTADFAVPPWTPQGKNSPNKYTSNDLPIPLSDVRLIATLTDDTTNFTRDVVVKHMHLGPPYIERSPFSNLPKHTRYISMGKSEEEAIEIPWPDEQLSEQRATEADTRRLTVETKTYLPSPQLHLVLPDESVMDELRPRYARDRMTHDLDFVKKKVLVDMKNAWERERQKRGGGAIGTPKSEYWARETERRNAEREQRLKEGPDLETLKIIEEEMGRMGVSA